MQRSCALHPDSLGLLHSFGEYKCCGDWREAGTGQAASDSLAANRLAKTMQEVPVDPCNPRRCLTKGDFTKCFEISRRQTLRRCLQIRRCLKSLQLGQYPKMSTETSVRLSLSHHHAVGFHGFLEDNDFAFMVSGLCWRSLLEAAGTCTETASFTRTSGWVNASCLKVWTWK